MPGGADPAQPTTDPLPGEWSLGAPPDLLCAPQACECQEAPVDGHLDLLLLLVNMNLAVGTIYVQAFLLARVFMSPKLVAQMVKRLSTMRETQVQSLGWEDPLGKEMANHSSTVAWKIPLTEESGGCSPWGLRVRHD